MREWLASTFPLWCTGLALTLPFWCVKYYNRVPYRGQRRKNDDDLR